MGLRHIVLLTLDESCDVDGLIAELRALPAAIPSLRRYDVGRDAGLSEGNATVAVIAEVDDEAGFVAYRDHPEHQRVLQELIHPHLVHRAALQTPLDPPF